MPYNADIRCGYCQIQLNKCHIAQMFRSEFDMEVINDFAFHVYVEALEFELNKSLNFRNVYIWIEWFLNNYNSIEEYNELNYEEYSSEEDN